MAEEATRTVIPNLVSLLEKAMEARQSLFDTQHESAFRLFNGFMEGNPELVIDLYASTLLIHNYADDPTKGTRSVQQAQEFLRNKLVWLHAGIVKTRNGNTQAEKRGQLLFG